MHQIKGFTALLALLVPAIVIGAEATVVGNWIGMNTVGQSVTLKLASNRSFAWSEGGSTAKGGWSVIGKTVTLKVADSDQGAPIIQGAVVRLDLTSNGRYLTSKGGRIALIRDGGVKSSAGRKPQPGKLTGEIFIVTNGAQNYKLGLVTVSLISESAIAPFIRRVEVSEGEHCEGCAYYFSLLPKALTVTKTDGDGHFTLRVPRQGRFAIAAHASRRVADSTEEYYWLVWVSLAGEAEKHVMLSNDNLTTTNSPDSAITVDH